MLAQGFNGKVYVLMYAYKDIIMVNFVTQIISVCAIDWYRVADKVPVCIISSSVE